MAHLLIGAPHKSSGKTTVTLGLCAALARRGLAVQPFKKGPDYIDPMWLGRAAGRPCHNLDFNTMGEEEIRATFARYAAPADISLVEGNMGLFDSLDVEGRHSNAALARLLEAPVVLLVNVGGMTRSVVPLIQGFCAFEPELRIAGVILNQVAGERHEQRLREALGRYLDLPLLGAIHRDPALAIDERHLGLIPSNEAAEVDQVLGRVADGVARYVDLDALMAVAATAPPTRAPDMPVDTTPPAPDVRIGIARDAAFGFYYPSDLERLRQAGAELVDIDTLRDPHLPPLDGLFIGGGFPETQMEALERNTSLRASIRRAIDDGLPVYAECGGLMYLTRSIRWGERVCRMVGALPGDTVMQERPVGRGILRLRPSGNGPWPGHGDAATFNAHEFHYSRVENLPPDLTFAYEVVRGAGLDGRHDGIVYRNLLANYAHLRDVDSNHWTERFVAFVRRVRQQGTWTGGPKPPQQTST